MTGAVCARCGCEVDLRNVDVVRMPKSMIPKRYDLPFSDARSLVELLCERCWPPAGCGDRAARAAGFVQGHPS